MATLEPSPGSRCHAPAMSQIEVTPARRRRRWPLFLGLGVVLPPFGLFGLSMVLTPPLEPPTAAELVALPPPDPAVVKAVETQAAAVSWPEGVLDGPEAKALLLNVMLAVQARLEAQPGYTVTFKKSERIDGQLQPEQTLEMKIRHKPFGLYLKFLKPDAGKEVVYHEGHYDNDLIAHGGKLTRLFLPRLKVPPDSPLALKGNRHPVTEAGLLNLTRKLVRFRMLDLNDVDAGTVLDRVTEPDGKTYLRSVHTHPHNTGVRPFSYVEILYDPETRIPVRFTGYDWPQSDSESGERILGEQYCYEALNLEANLTDLDFDPANPAYEFKRF